MQTKSKLTQQRILAAARQLFFEYGISDITQQQISDAAGINRGLIFHYFRTKDSIAALIFEEYMLSFFSAMRDICGSLALDPIVAALVTERVLISLPRRNARLTAFFSEIIRSGLADNFLQQQIFAILSRETSALTTPPEPKKLRIYAEMLASLIGYLLSTDFVAQHGISPDFAAQCVRDIHMNLLHVDPERRAELFRSAETIAERITVSHPNNLSLSRECFSVAP